LVFSRITAWDAKARDNHMPEIEKGEINENTKKITKNNIYWNELIL
jgi:hypothetical protein